MKALVGAGYDSSRLKIQVLPADIPEKCTQEQKISLLGCDAGINRYTISWNGKLMGCQMLTCFLTDPLSEGFKKA